MLRYMWLMAAVLAASLAGCTSSSPSRSSYTLSVEVVDVGMTDATAPSGSDLAHLAGSTKCTAWVRDPTSQGAVDVVIRLLVAARPDQALIQALKDTTDVRSVVVGEAAAYASQPSAVSASIAPRHVPCGDQPI